MCDTKFLKDFYSKCKDLEITDSMSIIEQADTEEEADFFRLISDFILQQKQKQVIAEKRF